MSLRNMSDGHQNDYCIGRLLLYRMSAMTYLKELVGDYLLEEVKLKVKCDIYTKRCLCIVCMLLLSYIFHKITWCSTQKDI